MPYKARIVSINSLTPIPGKDFICAAKLNEIPDLEVIVSKDYSLTERYVFFHTDIQLSEEFAAKNDLIARKDESGKRAGGYFDDNRRVKCQKFAGIRSEGFLCKFSAFAYMGESALKELDKKELGEEFDSLNRLRICKKYYFRRPNVRLTKYGKIKNYIREHDRLYVVLPVINKIEEFYYDIRNRIEDFKSTLDIYSYNSNFQRHPDTEQLRENIRRIPIGSLIIITEKLHGTSARTSFLPDISLKARVLSWLGRDIKHKFYVGTRNVVLKDNQTDPYYDGEIFRWKIANKFYKMDRGEDFSYEIIGYNSQGPLMTTHSLDKIKRDYKSIKKFPNPIVYSYGLMEGECEERVYKYSKMVDGKMVVQSWEETKKRCIELGLKLVPELDKFVYDGDVEKFLARANRWLANDDLKSSFLDTKTLTEGICIRVEDHKVIEGLGFDGTMQVYIPSWKVYKHKSFIFGVLEGYLKDAGIEDDN